MPRAAAQPTGTLRDAVLELVLTAQRFIAPDRFQALVRRWLVRRDYDGATEDRQVAMMADATLLATDLLLIQPSTAGSTALDRLARHAGRLNPIREAALDALRRGTFRLLRLDGPGAGDDVAVRDAFTGKAARLLDADLPKLDDGTVLFGRLAAQPDGVLIPVGVLTPLDAPAGAAAHAHPAADKPDGLRWAEAVYLHVVRNGTLDVPGLNRPRAGFDALMGDATEAGIVSLALDWAALRGAEPDPALLQHTRSMTALHDVLGALGAAELAFDAGEVGVVAACERILAVQLDAISRRARTGSDALTPDEVRQALDQVIAAGRLPARARERLAIVLRRLGPAAVQGDPSLERLVQRIQALRAKTVEQGCTEEEALSAAAKVAELLDRHGLSLSELEFRAQPCEGIAVETTRKRAGAIDHCVPAIAAFFDCRVWSEQPKGGALRYVFFGLRGDVTAAQALYAMVERAFETETDAFRRGPLYAEAVGERRTASNSFQHGLAQGISAKLAALRAARRPQGSGRDLVPVKEAMVEEELAKLGLSLRIRTMRGAQYVLDTAYAAGHAAGERFEVERRVTRAA